MSTDTCGGLALGQTPSQTIGPFFHYGLPWKGGADLIGQSALGAPLDLVPDGHDLLTQSAPRGAFSGTAIKVAGRVLDGDGKPMPDALVEIWQADAAGRYASAADPRTELARDEDFIGFGRAATDPEGWYRFRTIRPGCVPGPGNSLQAPHIAISLFARGLLKRLATRLYFAGAPENDEDPVLALVPAPRRRTLLAVEAERGHWYLDLVLQGSDETVFFEF